MSNSVIPSYMQLADTDFFGWSMSSFHHAQTPENAIICRSLVDDQTIIHAMYQAISQTHIDSWCAVVGKIKFLRIPLEKLGYTGDEDNATRRASCRIIGELVRCLVNDVIYGAFIYKDVQVIDTAKMSEPVSNILLEYEKLASGYVRVIKSLRDTAEFLATKEWLEIDKHGKVQFTPETRNLCQGLLRIFVDNLCSSFVYTVVEVEKTDALEPETESFFLGLNTTNIVTAAVLGIYGDVAATHAQDSAIATIEHMVNLMCGTNDDKEVKNIVEQLALYAASTTNVVDGLNKEVIKSEAGAKDKKRRKSPSLSNLDFSDSAKLGHSAMRTGVIRSHLDGTLTTSTRKAKKPTGNGKVYGLIDCSGSTISSKGVNGSSISLDLLFEVFAMSLAKTARGRMDATIIFYGTNILHVVEINAHDSEQVYRQKLYGLTGRSGYYGNSEGVAFDYLLNLMAVEYRLKHEPQTVAFLTDGRILTDGDMSSYDLHQRISQIENPQVRILPMIVHPTIDSSFANAFRGCQFIHLKDIKQFGDAFSDLIRFVADVPPEALVDNPYRQIKPPL